MKIVIKRFIKFLFNKDIFFKPDIQISKYFLGTSYGGWEIPKNFLRHNSKVYLFGIGEDISFDLSLSNEYGMEIHSFDPTPKSLKWIEKQNIPNNLKVHPIGLSDHDGEERFHLPKNKSFVSVSSVENSNTICKEDFLQLKVKRLSTIMKEIGNDSLDLLKMDIEGSEYRVIDNMIGENILPSILLVEFHHRFKNIGIKSTKETVKKLKNIGYKLYSVSRSGEEFGFIYKDKLTLIEKTT